VAKAERAGAETGNRTARTERRVVDFRAVIYLQTIAGRITKRNQAANTPVVSERVRFGGNVNLGLFQPRRERVQRCRVGNLPAEETRTVRHRAVDDDALLPVVHPECQQGRAALYRLQADQSGSELPPVVERGRSEPGISQSLHSHCAPPAF